MKKSHIYAEMVLEAKKRFGNKISPCIDCYQEYKIGDMFIMTYWFNTEDHSTHSIVRQYKIKKEFN